MRIVKSVDESGLPWKFINRASHNTGAERGRYSPIGVKVISPQLTFPQTSTLALLLPHSFHLSPIPLFLLFPALVALIPIPI